MAKRSWAESMRNAALLGLCGRILKLALAERVGMHSSVLLVVILGRSVALFGIYWPSRDKGRLEGLGRSPAIPSFIVFSTRWKESRLNGV